MILQARPALQGFEIRVARVNKVLGRRGDGLGVTWRELAIEVEPPPV